MERKISIVDYKRGSYIFVEGEVSDGTFFIIQTGRVKLSRTLNILKGSDTNLGAGDFFEVESALTGKPRIYTAVAQEDCKIVVVPREMYNELIQKKPSLVQKIVLSFSKKMRLLDQTLARISFQQPHEPSAADHLVSVGDYYYKNDQLQPAAFAYHYFLKNEEGIFLDPDAQKRAQDRLADIKKSLTVEKLFLEEDTSKPSRSVPGGTMIFSETMSGNTMYFLRDGIVKICKISNNSEILLAVLGKGDLFGEMALLENKPRSATAITTKNSDLLVITYQNFPLIIKQQPTLITRITTVLAERIWFVHRQIANVILPEGEDRLYDALLMFMEKRNIDFSRKNPTELNMTLKEFLFHTGISPERGKKYFQELVNANAVHLSGDNTLVIHNPAFVHNRAHHGRKAYASKMKTLIG